VLLPEPKDQGEGFRGFQSLLSKRHLEAARAFGRIANACQASCPAIARSIDDLLGSQISVSYLARGKGNGIEAFLDTINADIESANQRRRSLGK
jgi:hypothetical protein